MIRTIDIVDTTTRDGNQSLWSATGPDDAGRPRDRADARPGRLPRRGLHVEHAHGRLVRFHQEDPWERIRLVSAAMPSTPLSFITTGMRFITWMPADEEVMRLSFRCVARNGIRRFQIADPSNDPPRLRRLAADGASRRASRRS